MPRILQTSNDSSSEAKIIVVTSDSGSECDSEVMPRSRANADHYGTFSG